MGENKVQEDYMFSRGFRDSARLHIQHLLWNIRLGWLLHPSILVPAAPQREDYVLHCRCRNWQCRLAARIITESLSQCPTHGFDISSELFPAKAYLPSNMKLEILDAFGTLPEHLRGKFDVVHIRAFTIVVKGDHPGVLLTILLLC
ncbi:uncharacterized protein EAF02_000941 [Botrytis sinoallii]|uniref:uncharacterized protein n=1 Tax=Botrytis sinoallii TaxID=1463999 RepID=UPI001900BD6A|nr:uncharacterized protein EAF02_000941 [Botrytis sinoallii]KAF7893403.1 hypothetical protein EAF02_000941 [Botrytis sinoallii]